MTNLIIPEKKIVACSLVSLFQISKVDLKFPGIVEIIPRKIMIEIPLPTPLMVIWSASHNMKKLPANIINGTKR